MNTLSTQHIDGYLTAWEEIVILVLSDLALVSSLGGLHHTLLSLRRGIRGAIGVLGSMAVDNGYDTSLLKSTILKSLNNKPFLRSTLSSQRRDEIKSRYDRIYYSIVMDDESLR